MKTHSSESIRKTSSGAAIGFALMLLAICPRCAMGQTNTFPASGNAGIGTTSPTQALDVNGQIVTTGSQTMAVAVKGVFEVTNTITNNANAIAGIRVRNTFNGNAGGTGNSVAGIDVVPTFAPSASIALARGSVIGGFFAPPSGVTITDVVGEGPVTVYSNVSGAVTNGTTILAYSPIVFGALKPTTQYGLHVQNQGISGTTNSYGLYVDAQSGSTNNYAAIFADGNVGIGTTTPGKRLEILATDGEAVRLYRNANSVGWGVNMKFAFNNSSNAQVDYAGVHGVIQSNTAGAEQGSLLFTTVTSGSLTEKMRINGSGYVGIGITNPGYKLDVQGGPINASGGLCIAGDCKTAWSQVGGGGAVASVFGRTGAVVAATNDYTWAQIDKTTSSLANLTTRSASDLSSGTLPDARFPTTLPSASGANLTALNASSLASGTVATARLGSGTADATTFLRGDNTWAVPSGGSQWTTSGSNINYAPAGNVGIGIPVPVSKLDVAGNINATGTINAVSGVNINGSPITSSQWTTAGANINYATGSVGIGTITPTAKLHVVGDGKFTGNLTVDGNIAAKYQDMAEWVPSSEQLPAGTVVVLDTTKSNQVISSVQAYDTRVAGVISEQPGIALGESGEGKVLVATTGRVLVNVDATNGPIHIGDLLVTGDVPGVAMKSEPIKVGGRLMHMPGTLIGKALEPLEKGSGKILVLLSLQ